MACFQSPAAKNIIYDIAKATDINLDMALKIKILEDWDISKYLPQLKRGLSNIESEKTSFSALRIGFIKSNLASFLLFPLLLLTVSLLFTPVISRELAG